MLGKAAVDYVNFALKFRSTSGLPISGLQPCGDLRRVHLNATVGPKSMFEI